MSSIPGIIEVKSWYEEILIRPSFIEELTIYQKSKVAEYANQVIRDHEINAVNLANSNPDYSYPDKYKDNYIGYWLSVTSGYSEAKAVIILLSKIDGKKESNNNRKINFENYLTEFGRKLLPRLKDEWHSSNFKGSSKKHYAFKLIAMHRENLLSITDFTKSSITRTSFYEAFQEQFGEIGDRKNLFQNIESIQTDLNSTNRENEIYARSELESALKFIKGIK